MSGYNSNVTSIALISAAAVRVPSAIGMDDPIPNQNVWSSRIDMAWPGALWEPCLTYHPQGRSWIRIVRRKDGGNPLQLLIAMTVDAQAVSQEYQGLAAGARKVKF